VVSVDSAETRLGCSLDFSLIESLKYRQLSYDISAKVDGLFFSLLHPDDFCLPPILSPVSLCISTSACELRAISSGRPSSSDF